MEFVTSIHCMDGRIQETVVKYMKDKFNAEYVDTITEPGPCLVLADQGDAACLDSVFKRVDISVHKHGSKVIAISGHHDCAGNPVSKEEQETQVKKSMELLKSKYEDVEVIGFYINDKWQVEEEWTI